MTNLIVCLLTLLFSLSSPAMERNATFWQSSLAAKTAVGPGTGIGPGAAHASEFVTSSAARRTAMREAGIPTSQQPIAQINTSAGRQYIYEVNGQRWAVTQQTTDRVAGHGPHWEAGRVKPPGDYGLDPLGRQRVFNDGKVKVDYGAE